MHRMWCTIPNGGDKVNIFVLDTDPRAAARMMCDKHIPKMLVESAQMMASALRRHGVDESELPLTRRGTPYKGGYPHHPCTIWVGDSYENFMWLYEHAESLAREYIKRFGKRHRTQRSIREMHQAFDEHHLSFVFRTEGYTPFIQAMPDKYRDDDAVAAYRAYYHMKWFAKWEKGTPAPNWWQGVEVTA